MLFAETEWCGRGRTSITAQRGWEEREGKRLRDRGGRREGEQSV